MAPLFIAIAGGSGSGKTTFARRIAGALGDDVLILSHDYYYKPFAGLSLEARTQQNFDHPSSFDTALLVQHLQALRQGLPVERPIYSYTAFTRLNETVQVFPTKVIIVEGFLILENADLRQQFDIKLFVDTDADVRFIRRMVRDVEERGRSMQSVCTQYLSTVKPMHEQFVEPSKKYADVIVPEGGYNQVALDMVVDRIRFLLEK